MADNPGKPVPVTSYPTALSVAQVGEIRFLTNTLAQQAFMKLASQAPPDRNTVIGNIQGDDGHVAAVVGWRMKSGWSLALAADKAIGSGASKGIKWEAVFGKSW